MPPKKTIKVMAKKNVLTTSTGGQSHSVMPMVKKMVSVRGSETTSMGNATIPPESLQHTVTLPKANNFIQNHTTGPNTIHDMQNFVPPMPTNNMSNMPISMSMAMASAMASSSASSSAANSITSAAVPTNTIQVQQIVHLTPYQLQLEADKLEREEVMKNFSRMAIRRMARRGGVKRVSAKIYPETRKVMVAFLDSVLRDVVTFLVHKRKCSVKPVDIVHALKRQGKSIYGFGNWILDIVQCALKRQGKSIYGFGN